MKKIFFISILSILSFWANAQGVRVVAKLDTNIVEIGNPVELQFLAEYNNNVHVVFPILEEKITNDFEIISKKPVDTLQNSPNVVLSQKYEIIAFPEKILGFTDSVFNIPPFQFLVNNDTLLSNELFLRVIMIQLDSATVAKLDTTQQFPIFEIKSPKNTPWTFAEFWNLYKWYVIIILLSIIIILLLVFIIIRLKKNKPIVVIEKPKIPPHITAIKSLNKLKNKKLLEQDKVKEYYTELTNIVRLYIEERFQIPALERTSSEILFSVKSNNIVNNKTLEKLKQILNWADLAKFAKHRPMQSDNDLNMENAFYFVNKTKIKNKELKK